MAKRWRRKLLVVKAQAGVDILATPAAVDSAILATGVELQPVQGDTVSRELERTYYGASPEINVNVRQSLSFSVEYASGGAGVEPGWGLLLRAAGMGPASDVPAVAEDSSVGSEMAAVPALKRYAPITGGEEKVSIFLWIDGVLHKLGGCRGTFTLSLGANGVPRIAFEFTGSFSDPADTANDQNPVPNAAAYNAWKEPVVPSDDKSVLLDFPGAVAQSDRARAVALIELSAAYGSVVTHDEAIGRPPATEIVDRAVTGTVTIDAPKVDDAPIVKFAREGKTGRFRVWHGIGRAAVGAETLPVPTLGKFLELDIPRMTLSSPTYSENNGFWRIQANFAAQPDDGNDELTIAAG